MGDADNEKRIDRAEDDIKELRTLLNEAVSAIKDLVANLDKNVALMQKDISSLQKKEESLGTNWNKYKPLIAYTVTALVSSIGTLLGTGTIPF